MEFRISPEMLLRLLVAAALLATLVNATSYSERKDKELKPYSYEEEDIDKGGAVSKGPDQDLCWLTCFRACNCFIN